MKDFLVTQQIIEKRDFANATINVIIRIVSAGNKESAIGKFILATQDVVAVQKFDLLVYELDQVSRVK